MKNSLRCLFLAALAACSVTMVPTACCSTGNAVVGHQVTFYLASINGTTTVNGVSVLSFQWNFNGAVVSGATGVALPSGVTGIAGSAYVIASVAAANQGTYTLSVTQTIAGTAPTTITSDQAVLTVLTTISGASTGIQVTQNGVTKTYFFDSTHETSIPLSASAGQSSRS